jgi:outer membrane protein assembly factor BamB
VFSSPTVVGDTVVVGSCNGFIHGIDRASGTPRWRYDARADGGQPEFHSAPLVVDGLALMASDDRRPEGVGFVYAIDATTGSVLWKTRIGRGSMTDLVRLGERLYTVTLDSELLALDLRTGRQGWSFRGGTPLGQGFVNVLATPAVGADRVYYGGTDGVVYALSPDTGAVVWKAEIGSRVVTPLVLTSEALYLGTLDGRLLRAEPASGRVRAELKVGRVPFGPLVPVGNLLLVYAVEGDAAILTGVESSLTAVRWTRRTERGWSSARPYLWQGLVLAGNEAGELSAFTVEDGVPVWSRRLDGVIRGIGLEADRLYVGTLRGAVLAIRAPSVDDD